MANPQMRMHDLAYVCFLIPGVVSAVIAIGSAIPMDSGMAGGFGLMLLVPLAIAALVTAPVGIVLSIICRKDGILPLLSVLTILCVTEIATEAGSAAFYKLTTGPVYAVLVLGLVGSWFFLRRERIERGRP